MPSPTSTIPQVVAQHGDAIAKMRAEGASYEKIGRVLDLGYHTVRQAARMLEGQWEPRATSMPELTRQSSPVADRRPTVAELRAAVEQDDDGLDGLDGLIDQRVKAYQRKAEQAAPKLYRIARPGAFAVCHLGDPHLDDDGCDWPELIRTIKTIRKTPGMTAGNIGDTTNNWVGRLQALYAHQTTTEGQAFELARWLLEAVEWDYLVLGNHDRWNQGTTIIRLLAERAKVHAVEDHEVRIEYADGVRLCARHTFKGSSMWNPLHGSLRRAKMRPWGDLLVSGHHHEFAHHTEELEGKIVHLLKLRGFKRFDAYAQEHDFADGEYGCSITTVHRPAAPHPGSRLTVWHDVEEAAAYLEWARRRDGG